MPLRFMRSIVCSAAQILNRLKVGKLGSVETPLFVVDSFTSRPFHGNPAGVCLVNEWGDDERLRQIAAEVNHAETAFVVHEPDGWLLRWFTPTVEVDLCGHATLAAAHILWEIGRCDPEAVIEFKTRSGVLRCSKHGFGIQMDFPSERCSAVADEATAEAIRDCFSLKSEPKFIGRNRMDILVELGEEDELRSLNPNLAAISLLEARGMIVTEASRSADFDFMSRFFAPAVGIPEDPVTGSAHCCLAPFWGEKLGKTDLIGFQASPRGGAVRVANRGDRVLLQGSAVTVIRGELAT